MLEQYFSAKKIKDVHCLRLYIVPSWLD